MVKGKESALDVIRYKEVENMTDDKKKHKRDEGLLMTPSLRNHNAIHLSR